MIDLDEIHTGDLVAIRDRAHNVARGQIRRGEAAMRIDAFGLSIPVLRLTATDHWRAFPGITVIEHTPALVGSEPA